MNRSRWRVSVLVVTVWAAFLRMPGLFANGFQADEALFASFARTIAVWRDPMLALQPVDKPPLLFYSQAVFFPLFGPVEWAARLPNFVASILLIPLTALLAWHLFGDALMAVLTAVWLSFSPLAIQFSPTAYTDPLLTTLLVAALAAVAGGRPFVSGLLFGLALATKYQAALFLPLLLGVGVLQNWRREWGRWLVGVGPVVTAVLLWEVTRTGSFSLWQTQISNFGGIHLTRSWEIWPRLIDWLTMWAKGAPVIGLLAVAGLFFLRRMGQMAWLLALFLSGYFLLHWLLAIPVWGRYLLPALPLAALLGSRLALVAANGFLDRRRWLIGVTVLVLVIGQAPSALAARDGRHALGSFPGADQGAAEVAGFLADAPYGTVLYDHWYSWQWRYHLFDKKVFVNWFPDSEILMTDLNVFAAEGIRYLVLPNGPAGQSVIREIRANDYQLKLRFQTQQSPGMILYQITR